MLEILGAQVLDEVHNHHDYAWREEHGGEQWWVVRKGCTPAFPGQRGFVGATMGEDAVILEGTEDGQEALFSTVHGAGRAMTRAQAAGKQGKVAACPVSECDTWILWRDYVAERQRRGLGQHEPMSICAAHPDAPAVRRHRRIKPGAIDFDQVRAELQSRRIELRGGAADEAPAAYKRLDQVLAAHGETIRVVHRLTPIGVAMAGADTHDPFKD